MNHYKELSGSAAGARSPLDPYREEEYKKFRSFGGRHSSNPHALKNLHHIQKYNSGVKNDQENNYKKLYSNQVLYKDRLKEREQESRLLPGLPNNQQQLVPQETSQVIDYDQPYMQPIRLGGSREASPT